MGRKWVLGVCLLLAACGGGDGSNDGTGAAPITIVTPTPSPTPSAEYPSARDFSADRSGGGEGVRLERFRPGFDPWRTVSLELSRAMATAGFQYSANPKVYSYYYDTESRDFADTFAIPEAQGLVGDWNFDPSAPSPIETFARWVEADDVPLFDFEFAGVTTWRSYTTGAIEGTEIGDREIFRYSLYGATTRQSDVPTTGTTTYQSKNGPLGRTESENLFTIDWATGQFSGSSILSCEDPNDCPNGNQGELRLSGSVNGNRINGSVSGSSGFEGEFLGKFFGPNALELGVIGTATHPTRDDRLMLMFTKRRD